MTRVATLVPALLLALSLVGGPTTAFALSATPGDTLYPAKLSLESVRLSLATNPLREIGLHLDFASLRLVELAGLLDTPNPESKLVEVVSQNFKGHVEEAREGLRVLNDRGAANGPRTTLLQSKVVQTAALSENVRLQCRESEAPAAAAQACQEIQPALKTTVHEFPELVVSDTQDRLLIALPLLRPPGESGSSNTSASPAGAPPASSQAAAESDATASRQPPASDGAPAPSGGKPASGGGEAPANSSGDAPADSSAEAPKADPPPPTTETAASPPPPEEPAPSGPTPSPTETPSDSATPTEPPQPRPSGDQAAPGADDSPSSSGDAGSAPLVE